MKVVKDKKLCIVGDIHGCYDEFIQLLTAAGYIIKNNRIIESPYQLVLIGDYVDKGPQVRQIVEFLYENRDQILIIIGNHENFNYKYLSGLLKQSKDNDNLIANYFDSIKLFESDEELKQKFFELFVMSFHSITNEDFVLTHAPCKAEYLLKEDNKSQRHQRTIVYPKSDINSDDDILAIRDEFFTFLKEETIDFIHVFGHVMLDNVHHFKNRIGIDTGCVAGGKLSAIVITDKNNFYFLSQKSFQPVKEKLYPLVKL